MKRKRWVSVLVVVGILAMMMSFAASTAGAREKPLTMEDVWAEIKAAEKEERATDFRGRILECLELSDVEINIPLNFDGATILGAVELGDVKIKDSEGLSFVGATLKGNLFLFNTEITGIFTVREAVIEGSVLLFWINTGLLTFEKAIIKGTMHVDMVEASIYISNSFVDFVNFAEIQVEHPIIVGDGALALAIHLSNPQLSITVPVSDLQDFFLGVKDSKLNTGQEKTSFVIEGIVVKKVPSSDNSDDIWYVNLYVSEKKCEIVLCFDTVKYHHLAKDLEFIELGDNLRVEIKDEVGATKEVCRVLDLRKLS